VFPKQKEEFSASFIFLNDTFIKNLKKETSHITDQIDAAVTSRNTFRRGTIAILALMTEVSRGFPQALESNAGMVSYH
jgi:hypothetical protein